MRSELAAAVVSTLVLAGTGTAHAQDTASQPAAQSDAPATDAPATPAQKPAPVTTGAAATASATSNATSAAADGPSEPVPQQKGGVALSVGAWLGGGFRLDDPPTYEAKDHGGLLIGGGATVWPTYWLGIGVSYEHLDLGSERQTTPATTFDVDRDLSTLWGTLRLAPWRAGLVPYLAIAGGVAWQSLDAVGTSYPFPQGSAVVQVRCEGSASASLALRANVGMEGRFDNGLVLFAEGGPDMIRLTDEPLDSCASGAGTVLDLGIRAGAQFRFDVTHSVR